MEQILPVGAATVDLHHFASDIGRTHDLVCRDDLILKHLYRRFIEIVTVTEAICKVEEKSVSYCSKNVTTADDLTLAKVGRGKLPLLAQIQGRDVHTTVVWPPSISSA